MKYCSKLTVKLIYRRLRTPLGMRRLCPLFPAAGVMQRCTLLLTLKPEQETYPSPHQIDTVVYFIQIWVYTNVICRDTHSYIHFIFKRLFFKKASANTIAKIRFILILCCLHQPHLYIISNDLLFVLILFCQVTLCSVYLIND